ncbi:MAG: hypothetical protein WCI48_00385 [Bacteroidota bacterium]
MTFIFGCKKDNSQNTVVPKVEYTGYYSFSTFIKNTGSPDTTILYDGYVYYDDFFKRWEMEFLPYQIMYIFSISPDVDSNGIITYPSFVKDYYPTGFFSGNFDGTGNVNFKFGYSIYIHSEIYSISYAVKGKRKEG